MVLWLLVKIYKCHNITKIFKTTNKRYLAIVTFLATQFWYTFHKSLFRSWYLVLGYILCSSLVWILFLLCKPVKCNNSSTGIYKYNYNLFVSVAYRILTHGLRCAHVTPVRYMNLSGRFLVQINASSP